MPARGPRGRGKSASPSPCNCSPTSCKQLPICIPLLPRAVEISSQTRVGVHDCLYTALAEREGCALVTADVRLVNVLVGSFPFLVDLATLP